MRKSSKPMNTKRIFFALTFVVVMIALAGSAGAQSNLKTGNTTDADAAGRDRVLRVMQLI